MSCRLKPVIGDTYIQHILQEKSAIIPCYWHQHHIFCTYYMLQLAHRGLKVGFLISPSVDGEVPAQTMRDWGAYVIRGSHTRTGAQAIKELFQLIKKEGVSPVNTPDGPTGPVHYFKPGTIMLSQLSNTPIVAISYACSNAWQLNTWDQFIIPKPFSTVQIGVAEPIQIKKKLSPDEFESMREQVEKVLLDLQIQCERKLTQGSE